MFSPSVIGQFIYGNVKERRRWDQAVSSFREKYPCFNNYMKPE